MSGDSEHETAQLIRNATVLWNEAARALDQGQTEIAAGLSRVGEPMIRRARRRIEAQEVTA